MTNSKFSAEKAVMIAILTAIASVSRVPFAMIPSVQPTTFVIILSALVFGWKTGLIVGLLSALCSNMFLGQGPWTLWQMVAWGGIGAFFGVLRSFFNKNKYALITCAFIAGILFGFFMNLWFLAEMYFENFWSAFLASIASSIYFDILHGLANAVLIHFFYEKWYKILTRSKLKYGL